MDDIETVLNNQKPTALRPLLGVTALLVEDSLASCDAIRLMCLRSGARIRRADCLESARRHLRVYRPNLVIVDMGLPDGSGAELISELARAMDRVEAIVGLSGDPDLAMDALKAGANIFVEKPIVSLAEFQTQILSALPSDRAPKGPRRLDASPISADPLAVADDLAHAKNLLEEGDQGPETHQYLATFLAGVARTASDEELHEVAASFAHAKSMAGPERKKLTAVIGQRLANRLAI